MAADKIYAVLTGDIVSSSRVLKEQGDAVFTWLKAGEHKLQTGLPSAVYGGIDIFRGDSWQLVGQDPVRSLRAALLLRAFLISSAGFDSRVAIGVGSIDFLPTEGASSGTGQAYRLSGEGLGRLRKPVRMSAHFPGIVPETQILGLNTMLGLMDLQVQRWTRKQAEAVSGALVGLNQQQIAARWLAEPVSQQAISQHLESAGWSQIDQGVRYFENLLPTLFQIPA